VGGTCKQQLTIGIRTLFPASGGLGACFHARLSRQHLFASSSVTTKYASACSGARVARTRWLVRVSAVQAVAQAGRLARQGRMSCTQGECHLRAWRPRLPLATSAGGMPRRDLATRWKAHVQDSLRTLQRASLYQGLSAAWVQSWTSLQLLTLLLKGMPSH
jgi:hypothetical protein